jgi:DNA-binding HxlR family transcriptional regulator/putative sterol carrier protein
MTREYRQFCGLARAMELVGGRWTLLIVRDLLAGPKRFTDLREGLPGIPTNVLSGRLRELEEAGIARRAVQPRPATGVAYELTEYGRELEQAIVTLGVWGARSMEPRRDDDFVSIHALGLGLRGMFVPDEGRGRHCEYALRIEGAVLRVSVHDGEMQVGSADDDADVVIETDADTMHAMLTGHLDLAAATSAGRARIEGSDADAAHFFQMFRIATSVDDARV